MSNVDLPPLLTTSDYLVLEGSEDEVLGYHCGMLLMHGMLSLLIPGKMALIQADLVSLYFALLYLKILVFFLFNILEVYDNLC